MSTLENWKMCCPECWQDDELDVEAKVMVRLTSDGTDADASDCGDHEWNDDSRCTCANCGWTGTVADAEEAAANPPTEADCERAARAEGWTINADGKFEYFDLTDGPDAIDAPKPGGENSWRLLCDAEDITPTLEQPKLLTYRVEMSETVYYQFDMQVHPDRIANGDDVEEMAEEYFTNVGPKQEWFSHCEARSVDSCELEEEKADA